MTCTIQFCGAAGAVTGSCYRVMWEDKEFLVDCGLYQGPKTLKELNYRDFPFNPGRVDFLLLTHAHIDHSGLIPKLAGAGFTGPIYTTAATCDLLSFMLPDSGNIQESEVRLLNRRNQQRGLKTVSPIYTQEDAENVMRQLTSVDYDKWVKVAEGVRVRYWNAGHILGSASIEIELGGDGDGKRPLRLLFSGDIGPEHKLFHPDPEAPLNLDYVICESTYGDRVREVLTPEERRTRLGEILDTALAKEGVVVIPAFSVERTQELLADISNLIDRPGARKPLVFLDSPLAIRATKAFQDHAHELENINGDGRIFNNEHFQFTNSVEESKAINNYASGVVIIAASGMCEAGRIRHHLKRRLWEEKDTILLTGYNAPGTLGALLEAGKTEVKIHGEDVKVRASIVKFDAYSGHADANGLVEWVLDRRPISGAIFLTHGEPEGRDGLMRRLIAQGIDPSMLVAPQLDEVFTLGPKEFKAAKGAPPRLAPAEIVKLDWHNDLAQLQLDIREELDKAADEKARAKIIRRLRRALGDGGEENGKRD
ncbi:MAG TPA: MBL fold metallo-hydrolase [Parvularculaceae bacterium]|nr:MBL fold metallo-hydrolase [Amphiplicatus sp.]MCB9954932.1 MBL fold metallo-hydrolase [Caulobacterales bacterium]HPE31718.1 MBL fold metallo-hydrolase [Parvularculaceae bacterium]HRX38139.1 MBL fold metallo-hydrolase [Parvularculaceae bacterium]